MTTDPTVQVIDDVRALKALAHPLRLDLLEAVGLHSPLTATRAADLVGESPANCSWHLRQLAKYGFIEEVPGATGRERPWRRTSAGLAWDQSGDANFADASRALTEVFIDRELRLLKDARLRPQPEGWQEAVIATSSIAWLTADEVEVLGNDLMQVLSRFRGRVEDPAKRPEGARPVRLMALASPDDSLLPTPGDPHA